MEGISRVLLDRRWFTPHCTLIKSHYHDAFNSRGALPSFDGIAVARKTHIAMQPANFGNQRPGIVFRLIVRPSCGAEKMELGHSSA